MKNLLITLLVLAITTTAALAQNSKDETEILRINDEIDRAFVNKDISVFERLYAEDFVSYGSDGTFKDRTASLDGLRQWFKSLNDSGMVNSGKGEDIKIRVSGDLAVVTGKWNDIWKSSKQPDKPIHKDSGRFTGIFEKRNGKWVWVADHFTEAAHDKSQTEAELNYAGREFITAVEKKDKEALDRYIADDYVAIDENTMTNKEQLIGFFTSPGFKYISAKFENKKFNFLNTNTAVENGKMTIVFNSEGKQNTKVSNYTTVWFRNDGRWQVVADHFSPVVNSSEQAKQ